MPRFGAGKETGALVPCGTARNSPRRYGVCHRDCSGFRTKERQSPRQKYTPLVSIMKSDALMMTAAAVLASILISLAPHVPAIFGSSEAPRLLHTSRQTLRLWNRPSIVIHRAEVVLNPRPLFG
jgi:hypothetical protein